MLKYLKKYNTLFSTFFLILFFMLVKSCKELKSICSSCKSGFYAMDFDEATQVYCDMETDGGFD